ncbi:MAG: restriction endonuclease subunit S [Butyribacter sp.]|nr:restriction endonuclease subunit S [Butyribacter sp.]
MGNTPNIRFDGFTDAWEQRKLSDLIIEYKETVDSDCTLPVLTSSKTEGVVLQEEHFGRVQNHDITGYNILPRNYCTYRNRSDGVDFTFNINRCCDKGIISKFYPVFYGNNSDIFFISMVLNYCDEVVHEIAYTCTGTGQKVLSFLDLQKMNIRVPNYDEQKKISQFFEELDNLITLHQCKCDEIKELKKFMLQKMFPKKGEKKPEIRFQGFTDAWEQRKLGDIADVTKLAGFEFTEHVVYSDEGNIIALRGLNIKNGQLVLDDVKYIDGSNFSKLNRSKLYIDDIMFTYVGTVGEVAIIKENNRFYLAPNVSRIRIQSDDSPKFISHYMRTDSFYKSVIYPLIATSSQPALSMENIRKFEICLPQNREEQDRLSEWFDELDNLITLHQRKCDEIKELKKFMLQNMFPQKG